MKKVAVEPNISSVREALTGAGFEVVPISEDLTEVDAVIVSGLDVNFMGKQDISSKVPVIDVRGLTPLEVVKVVQDATAVR